MIKGILKQNKGLKWRTSMDYVRTDENGKTGHLQIQTSSSSLMARMGVLNCFIYGLTPEGDLSKGRQN